MQTAAFSVEPTLTPKGSLRPSRVIPSRTMTVCPATTTPSPNSATTSRPSRRRLSCAATCSRVRRISVRLTALRLVAATRHPDRPGLQAGRVPPRRHPEEDLLQHPGRQRIRARGTPPPPATSPPRPRGRAPAAATPGSAGRPASARSASSPSGDACAPPDAGPSAPPPPRPAPETPRPAPRRRSACTHVSRLSRVAVIPPTNGARTCSSAGLPGHFPLRSLPLPCSLRHGGSFGPGPADRVFWRTRFSGPPGSRRYSLLKFNRDRDIPLLRALVWTPQRMAVEWNYVDLALFDRLPRSDQSLRVVVEAKKMDNACLSSHVPGPVVRTDPVWVSQADRY